MYDEWKTRSQIYKRIYMHAAHQFGRFDPADRYERCGFLFSQRYGSHVSFVEIDNAHLDPATNFSIRRQDYARVMKQYWLKPGVRGVVGILHTHPGYDRDGWYPSANDFLTASQHSSLVHTVYHPYTRRVTIYNMHGNVASFHVPARLKFIG